MNTVELVQFGLGNAAIVDSVEVTWPDGTKKVLLQPGVNKKHKIIENP